MLPKHERWRKPGAEETLARRPESVTAPYEVKRDYPGAVKAWQRFLALVPTGEDHERIAALVKDAQDKQRTRR